MEDNLSDPKLKDATKGTEWSPRWRIPRLVVFFFGIITNFWFFYNFIGLTIGLLYYLFLKERAWRRNGIILAFYTGILSMVVNLYKDFPPLNIANWATIFFISFFVLFLVILELSERKSWVIEKYKAKLIKKSHLLSKKTLKAIKIGVFIIPIIFWSLVNLNFKVMFDNNPRLLWINAPSKIKAGTKFNITVEAWDAYERLSATYVGTVNFSVESYDLDNYNLITNPIASLPNPYTFTGQIIGSDIAYEIFDGQDNGLHNFEVIINSPGIHYFLVEDSVTKNTYYSNPVMVDNYPISEPMLVWGDIHTHSQMSDGTGTPEQSYYYARQVACLDFNALTDHGEIMTFLPISVDLIETATDNAYKEGEFVTFHGIEWTNVPTGHFTCIYSGPPIKNPIISYLNVPTTDVLWDIFDDYKATTGYDVLALPHHTTKKTYPQDWSYLNLDYVKIAEVTSVHGDCLFDPNDDLNYRGIIMAPQYNFTGSSLISAFNMGKRMTIYASSDEHDGHPGHSLSHTDAFIGHQRPTTIWNTRNEHPYPGGITAVFVDELTRDGVFSGLQNQRIYASSDHGRPILLFDVNGVSVGNGSTVTVETQTSTRTITIDLYQDGAPAALWSQSASATPNWAPNWNARVEIIKNGALWHTVLVKEPVKKITVIDREPIVGTSYEDYIQIGDEFFINSASDNPVDPTTLNTGGSDYYVVRVVGSNGRHSYAGPIWVEY